ncbi:MAG: class II aldolase/adducin family protein [Clostridiales bacterium]|nr:class II aldolase/adducin family protein [Clostridiales bacterium]
MDIMQAKELVVDAGKKLVESGLVARTWGNVSCRVSETQFVITPSGIPYEALTPNDIVLVNIADLSYDQSGRKPSSEKGIHAEAYKLRSNCNFVIHTHQTNASVVSTLGVDINKLSAESAAIIGSKVPLATYGLPGRGKLRKGVATAIASSNSKAIMMAHHGAVCLGDNFEDAFVVANELEKVCEKFILDECSSLTGKVADSLKAVNEYVLAKSAKSKGSAEIINAYISEREGNNFKIYSDESKENYATVNIQDGIVLSGVCPPEAALHRAIYLNRADVNGIIHSKQDDIWTLSQIGKTVKPLLDDFAQIAGCSLKVAVYDPKNAEKTASKVVKKMKGRSAVLLKDNGALCCGPSMYDAQATEMVVEKNCKTVIGAKLFDNVNPLGFIDTHLMRFVYLKKYSKQADKKQ